MPKPEQPASWRPFIKPPAQAKEKEEPPLNLDARAQLPISPPTAARAPSPSRNFTESAQAEVRRLKARYSLATVKLALSCACP
jgi:hypothetical protein